MEKKDDDGFIVVGDHEGFSPTAASIDNVDDEVSVSGVENAGIRKRNPTITVTSTRSSGSLSPDDANHYRRFNYERESLSIQSIYFAMHAGLTFIVYMTAIKDWAEWFSYSGEVQRKIPIAQVIMVDVLVLFDWVNLLFALMLWLSLYRLRRARTEMMPIESSFEKLVSIFQNVHMIGMLLVYLGWYLIDLGNDCRTENNFEACPNKYNQTIEYVVLFVPLIQTLVFRNITSFTKRAAMILVFVGLVATVLFNPEKFFVLLLFAFPITALIVHNMDRLRVESYILTRDLDAAHKKEKNYLQKTHQEQMKSIVANIAHDLRTPLTSIGLGTDLVLSMLEDEVVNSKKVPKLPDSHGNGTSTTSSTGGGGGNNLRTVIDSVSSITNSISVINIAVNQCLDFARSQNGRVVLIPSLRLTSIRSVAKFAVSVAEEIICSQVNVNVTIKEGIEDRITTDPVWLRESLYNVLLLVAENIEPVEKEKRMGVSPAPSSSSSSCSSSSSNGVPNVEVCVELQSYRHLKRHLQRSQLSSSCSVEGTIWTLKDDLDSADEGTEDLNNSSAVFLKFQVRRRGRTDHWKALSNIVSNAKTITTQLKGGTTMGIYSLAERINSLKGVFGVEHIDDGIAKNEDEIIATSRSKQQQQQQQIGQDGKQEQEQDKYCHGSAFFAVPYVPHKNDGSESPFSKRRQQLLNKARREEALQTSGHFSSTVINSRNCSRNASPRSTPVSSPRRSGAGGGEEGSLLAEMMMMTTSVEEIGPGPVSSSRTRIRAFLEQISSEKSSGNVLEKLFIAKSVSFEDGQKSGGAAIELSPRLSPRIDSSIQQSTSQSQTQQQQHSQSHQQIPLSDARLNVDDQNSAKEELHAPPPAEIARGSPFCPPPIQISPSNSHLRARLGLNGLNSDSPTNDSPLFRATKMHVLVVEDTLSVRKMMIMLLKRDGHTVDTAENGQVGVDKWNASIDYGGRPYDLILMDIQMPVLDGLAAMRHIRSAEEYRHQKYKHVFNNSSSSSSSGEDNNIGELSDPPFRYQHIIAMSANDATEYRNMALQAGSDSYMTKPFNMKTLYQIVEESRPT